MSQTYSHIFSHKNPFSCEQKNYFSFVFHCFLFTRKRDFYVRKCGNNFDSPFILGNLLDLGNKSFYQSKDLLLFPCNKNIVKKNDLSFSENNHNLTGFYVRIVYFRNVKEIRKCFANKSIFMFSRITFRHNFIILFKF